MQFTTSEVSGQRNVGRQSVYYLLLKLISLYFTTEILIWSPNRKSRAQIEAVSTWTWLQNKDSERNWRVWVSWTLRADSLSEHGHFKKKKDTYLLAWPHSRNRNCHESLSLSKQDEEELEAKTVWPLGGVADCVATLRPAHLLQGATAHLRCDGKYKYVGAVVR